MSEKQITNKPSPIISVSDLLPAFPSEEAFEDYLAKSPRTWDCYLLLPPEFKQTLVNYCIGKTGPKVTYDSIFRKIFDPSEHPDRLESLLSAILGCPIRIINVLSRKGTQISEHTSFVIMDVLVQTDNGTYADLEMQKLGYDFPLSRADCYASDIILRQYSKIKREKGQTFKFNDLQKVYCIVLMEKSPAGFHSAKKNYIHKRTSSFDTGIYPGDAGLHEDIFLCIDTFHEIVHTITKESNILDAWMTFLCAADTTSIGALIEAFPDFIPIYQEIKDFIQDPEELMHMLSEELYIMDKNTERWMVTTREAALEQTRAELEQSRLEAAQAKAEAVRIKSETALVKSKYSIALLAYQKHSPAEIAEKLSIPLEEVEQILSENIE